MNLKLLINLFAYSGSNFKAMRGLDTQIAMTVLQGVIKKEMSIQEVTVECREMKLKEVQEMFVRLACLHGEKQRRNSQPLPHQKPLMNSRSAL